jgi:hypothetical protein
MLKKLPKRRSTTPSSTESVETVDLLWLLFASMMGIVCMTPYVDRIAIPQTKSSPPRSTTWQEYASFEKVVMPADGYALYHDKMFDSSEQLVASLPSEGKTVVLQVDTKRTFNDVITLKLAIEEKGKEVLYEFEKL